MTSNESALRVKLPGGPEQTVSSVFIDERRAVVFELFDFSPAAQEHFGNDIAITIVVATSERGAMALTLGLPVDAADQAVLAACATRFESYFDVQPWLEEHNIRFAKEFDSWA